ncbi:MAG: hypothetical protein WC712_12940, partial [Candidatus Brocadiia bacterium]
CKIHKDYKFPTFKCSACYECPNGCWGVGWMSCPNKGCMSPNKTEVKEEFARLSTERKSWLDSCRAAVEGKIFPPDSKLAGTRALHVETEHFRLASTMKPRSIKLNVNGLARTFNCNSHQAVHVYARRAEDAYVSATRLLGCGDGFKPFVTDKYLLLIWQSEAEQVAASRILCQSAQAKEAYAQGQVYTTRDPGDDNRLFHQVVHSVAHFMGDDFGGQVLASPAWLREAFAQWVEYDVTGELVISCEWNPELTDGSPSSKLKSSLKPLVRSKSKYLTSLADYVGSKMASLTGWQRIKGIGILDWMLEVSEKKSAGLLIAQFKKDYPAKSQEDIFKAVLGMDFAQFEDKWSSWVLDAYPDFEGPTGKLTSLPEGL